MISTILIPADLQEPLRQVDVEPGDLRAWQDLVEGPIDAMTLYEPEASFFINDEGKLRRMEFNHRATALLWVHNPPFREQDVIMGPVVLHGPVGPDGESTSVPAFFEDLLLKPGPFQVELTGAPEEALARHERRYEDWFDAYVVGLELTTQGQPARGMCVVRVEP